MIWLLVFLGVIQDVYHFEWYCELGVPVIISVCVQSLHEEPNTHNNLCVKCGI